MGHLSGMREERDSASEAERTRQGKRTYQTHVVRELPEADGTHRVQE